MILPRPHTLEGRMLKGILAAPRHSIGICLGYSNSDLIPDDGDLTKPAVITVSSMDEALCVRCRHARLRALLERESDWRSSNRTKLRMLTSLSPDRIGPGPNRLTVSAV